MENWRPSPWVLEHYPSAIRASALIESFLWFAREKLGIQSHQIASLCSICSDDLNSVELPNLEMVGPFMLGGLNGYPFVGKTGLGAFSHHVPVGGAAVLLCGPHVGITDAGQVGKVVRPGQSDPSPCCGAATAGLKKLLAGELRPKCPSEFDPDDYQQETLEQLILNHASEILGPSGSTEADRFKRLTEVIYRELRNTVAKLLHSMEFHVPAFVFGGIIINEDHGRISSIEMRDVHFIHNGEGSDIHQEFFDKSRSRFEALKSGQANVFR
ncbi:MAG: hypothetical protein U0795_21305 [Pirellulales bacterium]